MRRMIDDDQVPVPEGRGDDELPTNWAVTVLDDYEDASPRIALVVEEVGSAGLGFTAHLDPARARRLRLALGTALAELGEEPGR